MWSQSVPRPKLKAMHDELVGPTWGVVAAVKTLVAFLFPLATGALGWWSFMSARRTLRRGAVRRWIGHELSRKEYPVFFWYFVIGQFVAAVFCAVLTIFALVAAWAIAHEP
jgi:hypothetical protein